MPSIPLSQFIRFDNFELDLRAGELRKGGVRIRLQEQPLLVLQALLEKSGQVVTREELQTKIWPANTFVDFDHGVHAAVNRLRAALNDSADQPRYVETVARRGYRFIGHVDSPAIIQIPPAMPAPVQRRSRVWNSWTGALAGFLIASAVTAALVGANAFGLRDWLFTPRRQFHSLAVLPLDNLTGDPKQDYFADEMTEELITQFSKLGNLRVISRTSVMQYKGTKKTIPQIAGELHVDAIMEGAVQLVGDRVRITAQLADGASDEHIWADSYDRQLSDVLLLQNEVASDIARQIDLQLTPQQKQRLDAAARPVNPEAYQAYLLGRYYWDTRTAQGLEKAQAYFDDAIKKDPNFALAYAGKADYFAYLTVLGGPEVLKPQIAMEQARAAAQKALQLDPLLAEAHASMGNVLHNYDWNWTAAEHEFQRAIELNPNYANAHHLFAHLLIETGRTNQALEEERHALELDPYSPFINNGRARLYYLSRQYDKAISQCQVGLQINPDYLPAHIQLALAYEQVGKLKEAVTELEQAAGIVNGNNSSPDTKQHAIDLPVLHALLAHAYALAGRKTDAYDELKKLQTRSRQQYISPAYFAIIWVALGNRDQAFAALDQAYQDRSEHVLYLGLEPIVDPLRSDPRFDGLLHKIGLPAQH